MTSEDMTAGDWYVTGFVAAYPRLRRFAAVVADTDMDPDDVLHDALVATLAAEERGARIADHEAYLRTATFRAVLGRRRRAAGARARYVVPEVEAVQTDRYPSDVAGILDRLEPADRALLYLVDVEGWTSGEAARALGTSSTAARARLSRARRRLRRDPTLEESR